MNNQEAQKQFKQFKQSLIQKIKPEIKETSQKILNSIDIIEQDFQETFSLEFIWALIKNNQHDEKLSISMQFNQKNFIYSHDGKGFSIDDLACIIKAQSNKKNKNGCDGINFLNSHILSRKIQIDTKIAYQNNIKRIKYKIDRSDRDIQNFSKKTLENINTIEFSKQVSNINKFTFLNYKQQLPSAMQFIVNEFKRLIPYILIFNRNIVQISFKSVKQHITISAQNKNTLFQFDCIKIIEKNNKNNQSKQLFFARQYENKDSVVVPIHIIKQKQIQIIDIGDGDLSKLYRNFPIRGQEIGYNVVINSEIFETNRKNILINKKFGTANKEVFQNIMKLIPKLFNKLSKYTFFGQHLLIKNNSLKSNFVDDIENKYVKLITYLNFTFNGKQTKFKDVDWIRCSHSYLQKHDQNVFYQLAYPHSIHFQNEKQYKKCLQIIQKNYQLLKDQIDQFSIQKLVKRIQAIQFQNLNKMILSKPIYQYLNDFYKFLQNNYPRAITKYVDQTKHYKIFLNQENQFVQLYRLHVDKGIPEIYKNILKQGGINYRAILLNKQITSKIIRQKIEIRQIQDELINFFQLKQKTILSKQKLNLLFKLLISYSKDQNRDDQNEKRQLRKKMFAVYKNISFLQNEETQLTENIYLDYKPYIQKFTISMYQIIRQSSENLKKLSELLKKDIDVINWFSEYYALSKQFNNIKVKLNVNEYNNFVEASQLYYLNWNLNEQEKKIYKEYYNIIKHKKQENEQNAQNKQINNIQIDKQLILLGEDIEFKLLNKKIKVDNFKHQGIKQLTYQDFFKYILKLFQQQIKNPTKPQYTNLFISLAIYYIKLQDQKNSEQNAQIKLLTLSPIRKYCGDILFKYMLDDENRKYKIFLLMRNLNQLEYIDIIRKSEYNFQNSLIKINEYKGLKQKQKRFEQEIKIKQNHIEKNQKQIQQLKNKIEKDESKIRSMQKQKQKYQSKQKQMKQKIKELEEYKSKYNKMASQSQQKLTDYNKKSQSLNKKDNQIKNLIQNKKVLQRQKSQLDNKYKLKLKQIQNLKNSLQQQRKKNQKSLESTLNASFIQEKQKNKFYQSKLPILKQELQKILSEFDLDFTFWNHGVFKIYKQKKLFRKVLMVFTSIQQQNRKLYKIYSEDIDKLKQGEGLKSKQLFSFYCIYNNIKDLKNDCKFYSEQNIKITKNYVEYNYCKNKLEKSKKLCNSDLKFQMSLTCYNLSIDDLIEQNVKPLKLEQFLKQPQQNKKNKRDS